MTTTGEDRIHVAATALLGSPFTGAGFLERFIGRQQRMALHEALHGEEGLHIADQVIGLMERIQKAPVTYEQAGLDMEAVVHLHYFRGGSDWWIYELDVEDKVSQASSFTCLNGDRMSAEFGYTCISELVEGEVELDIHWMPKPISEAFGRR